jgi:hypothetical protein
MNRLTLRSRISADGVLRLDLPLGPAEAELDVQITIEPLTGDAAERADWATFVRNTAGAWQGEFERMPPGELETRDTLP